MSTTNLLTQNDNLRRELSKEHVGRSVHQIGNNMQFPAWIGPIYPICCKPTIPTQGLKISVSAMISQISPLKVPLSAKLRLNTAFYFVDQRLTWKKWERFMTGGVSGNENYNLPFFINDFYGNDKVVSLNHNNYEKTPHNELLSYFNIGLYEHHMSVETIDTLTGNSDTENDGMFPEASPFLGYQMICRDYYTTVDRLPTDSGSNPQNYDNDNDWSYNNLFPPNDDDFRLKDGANYLVNGVRLGKIRYHEVRQDYFSSCFKSPMRGTSPTIGLNLDEPLTNVSFQLTRKSNNLLPIVGTGANDELYDGTNRNLSILRHNGVSGLIMPTQTSSGTEQTVSNEVFKPTSANTVYSNVAAADYNGANYVGNINTHGQLAYSVTAAQITWLQQVTTWKELNILAKPYYRDFLNAHYENVNIGDEQTERPIYIGGTSQSIDISEVTQTSYSSDSPLGNKGATVHSLDSNFVGSFFCNNHGWIIGVAYIIPDFFYEPALPRYFSRRENLDFYSPEFANLSMQAILNKELFVSSDDDWNNQVLGYTGRFDELRSYPNYVCGDLLNSNYNDLKAWVLARRFDNDHKPAITSKYLNLRDNVDYSAFALGSNMPPFMAQFATDIMSSMPMPTVAVPKH